MFTRMILIHSLLIISCWSLSSGFQPASRSPLFRHPPTSRLRASTSVEKTSKTLDSLEKFQEDAVKVLRELRPYPTDPTVPKWVRTRRLSFSNYWSLQEWEEHQSRFRYIRYMRDLYKSRLLQRIWPQLTFMFFWTLFALRTARRFGIHRVDISLTSLSLVSTFVALLQTLRSNQGLARLSDARLSMGRMVLYARDTSQLMAEYIMPEDEQLGIRAARHLALFGWVLKSHLRETGANDIIDALLSPADAKFIKAQRKRPVAIIARIRQIMRTIYKRQVLGTTEHRLIEQNLQQLNDVIMTGERIRSSPVPPVYNAHATRLMTVYLLCLPFALISSSLDAFFTIIVTLTVSFSLIGLDEMSHMFEQPYRFMPLYHLSKVSMRDVMDAFCRMPPPLDCDEDEVETAKPSYWASKDDAHILPFDGSNYTDPNDDINK